MTDRTEDLDVEGLVERLRKWADIAACEDPFLAGAEDAGKTLYGEAATALVSLHSRLTKAEGERDACKLQAECWAMEARAHKSSLHEAYQAITGATGEPGNWHGAKPIIDALAASEAREAALREAAEQVVIAFGMGWDLDGVIALLRALIKDQSNG